MANEFNASGSLSSTDLRTFYKDLRAVVGAPHRFRASADPGGRAFGRQLFLNAPLVMIRPGRAKFTAGGQLQEAFKKVLGSAADEHFSAVDSGTGTGIYDLNRHFGDPGTDRQHYDTLAAAAREKRAGSVADLNLLDTNLRYFEFEPYVGEYLSTAMTLSSRIYARMSSQPGVNWQPGGTHLEQLGTIAGGFFTFWGDNSTSVSESANSEYGQSIVSQLMQTVSQASKEFSYFFGERMDEQSLVQSLTGALGTGNSNTITATLGSAIRGHENLLPNSWKNSSFQRSYNISFKFHSPYGHPEAIYQNVLLPFSMILALALPMMKSPGAYSQPYLFQLDCPGYFACDLGVCTSLSFTKGGSEGLWTNEGLPRQIDVTMTVEDLYPTLMASHNVGSLKTNIGLMTFLDNLAGVNLALSGQDTGIVTQLKQEMFAAINAPISAYVSSEAFFQDYIKGLTQLFR